MMQLIGERVRKYRRQKGWSQEQLGAMVGFSQSKISKIENGDWDSLSGLRLIAKVLGVPIHELVREDDDESSADDRCHGTRKMRIQRPVEKSASHVG